MSARLALVGAPGSGKSVIAAAVASAWGAELLDTDDLYEKGHGQRVADAVIEDELSFREAEEGIVLQALSQDGAVVAVGSGAVAGRVIAALAEVPVVWLQVGLVDAVRRSGLSGIRPTHLGPVRMQMHDMLKARDPVYDSVADHRVQTDGRLSESVAEEIVQWEASQ